MKNVREVIKMTKNEHIHLWTVTTFWIKGTDFQQCLLFRK